MRKKFVIGLAFFSALVVSCSSDDDGGSGIEIPAVESASIDIPSGGSTQPNQVYIDLSTKETTVVRRDKWEIGFYSGNQNRVLLNSSLLVSAAELVGYTDIDAVTEDSVLDEPLEVESLNIRDFKAYPVTVTTVGELMEGLPLDYGMYGNPETGYSLTDAPQGGLEGTAIAPVSSNPEENFVHLVSLGNEIPTEDAELGAVNTTGEHRGIYKIRVVMDGDTYVMQYAPFESDTHQEVRINKDENFNLIAFSFTDGTIVDVEPPKDDWDINFTSVYSFYGVMGNMYAGMAYSDFAVHNTLNGVGVYTLETDGEGEDATDIAFADFNKEDVSQSAFEYDDRRLIGSGWRSSQDGVYPNRFYVIKDTDGNLYKMRFTSMLSDSGERGYPQIEYVLLSE